MPLVYGQDERVNRWVAWQMGHADQVRHDTTIGWESGDDLKAALTFDGATGSNVFVHVASEVTLPRSLLRAGCNYIFGQLGCLRATFMVRDNNDRCMQLMSDLGLKVEGVIQGGHPEGHVYLFALWAHHPFVQRLFSKAEVAHGRQS